MSLAGKLKKIGKGVQGTGEEYLAQTRLALKETIPTPGTVRGAARGNVGDIAKLGGAALLFAGGAGAGARAVRGTSTVAREAPLASRIARTPLQFPNIAPERSMLGRVKNVLTTKMAEDRAASAYTASRQAALPGKIAELKTEIARIDTAPGNVIELARKAKTLPRVTPGERGSLRFPKDASAQVKKAHANVPKGQLLFTAEKTAPAAEDIIAFTKNTASATAEDMAAGHAGRKTLMERAARDVQSGRARIAGFYEKIKGEEGWIRAGSTTTTKGKPVSTLKFGEGRHAKNPENFYEAHIQGGSKVGAIKVSWLTRQGKPGNVTRELAAIGKGLKARGVHTIEHDPLSQSRSRLFARQLRGTGFKNVDLSEARANRFASKLWK